MEPSKTMGQPAFTLVDAHVHIHPCFQLPAVLAGAVRSFREAAARLGLSGAAQGCLMLAERAGAHWLRRARQGEEAAAGWMLNRTEEESSLIARHGEGESLILIAGRQLATRERLEVLALGRDVDIADGLPLAETLLRVRQSRALPVLPWGFGKWWGRRGGMVADLLSHAGDDAFGELYLGDNAGRLALAGLPRLLDAARKRGLVVLPGTDPLPLADHAERAGSFGFVLAGALDPRRPAEDLLRRIRALREPPRTYGRGRSLPLFLRDQAALRLRQVSA